MLKTNTKKARENLMKYIRDYSLDELTGNYGIPEEELETDDQIRLRLWNIFKREKVKHDLRFKAKRISFYDLFVEWAQGLAMGGLFCFWYNRSAVDDLGDILEETESEKARFTEEQAEAKLTSLIYCEILRNIDKDWSIWEV